MIDYEKVRLQNENEYSVVPGGLHRTDEKLELILILPEGKTIDNIDTETDNPENVLAIKLIDRTGDTINTLKGYVYQVDCCRKKNYVIGTEEVESGTDEAGEPIIERRDILGTVAIVELRKSDIRKEVENLKETVGMMLVKDLEV